MKRIIYAVLILAFFYISYEYFMLGYEKCKSNGNSTAWCLFTHKWQSMKEVL